jgi:hypothetical protein
MFYNHPTLLNYPKDIFVQKKKKKLTLEFFKFQNKTKMQRKSPLMKQTIKIKFSKFKI